MERKRQLRDEVLKARRSLAADQVSESASTITMKIQALPVWNKPTVVHVYLPITKNNEVFTEEIISWLWQAGHKVWTSCLSSDKSSDGFCKITPKTTYSCGRYKIPSPLEKVEKNVDPEVVILPCLAADKHGNRLGYGSGWYDWFLANHPKALRVGLMYDQFIYDEIPHIKEDQPLDILVSDKQVIRTERNR